MVAAVGVEPVQAGRRRGQVVPMQVQVEHIQAQLLLSFLILVLAVGGEDTRLIIDELLRALRVSLSFHMGNKSSARSVSQVTAELLQRVP